MLERDCSADAGSESKAAGAAGGVNGTPQSIKSFAGSGIVGQESIQEAENGYA